MKRRYTAERALENIARLREAFPSANFTTDLMVGFPGESEEDFLDTLRFVTEARLIDAHVFAYSRRERTPAAEFPDQVPEQTKKERSKRLIAHKNEQRDAILSEKVASGEPLLAIAESLDGDGRMSMHSDSFVEIKTEKKVSPSSFEALMGKWIKVKPLSHKNGILYCEML